MSPPAPPLPPDRTMHPTLQARRDFLATTASGIGTLALASLLREDGLLAAAPPPAGGSAPPAPASLRREAALLAAAPPQKEDGNPLAPRAPHFAPKAKACICIYLEGAPSQLDLFDPKPKLEELDGKPMPE